MARRRDLDRIQHGLERAAEVLRLYFGRALRVEEKSPGHPVTIADRAVDRLLRTLLPEADDGWLSEESPDDPVRLEKRRVWIVDPLDGTEHFLAGIDEWSVSIGLVEDGVPVAGGVCNPARDETVLGAIGTGVTWNGGPASVRGPTTLAETLVLASRSEVARGEWKRFARMGLPIRSVGSIAYKLALVAAGRADATWSLVPKHEWDVAGGAALVLAGGGTVTTPDGAARRFNGEDPRLDGVVALSAAGAALLRPAVSTLLR